MQFSNSMQLVAIAVCDRNCQIGPFGLGFHADIQQFADMFVPSSTDQGAVPLQTMNGGNSSKPRICRMVFSWKFINFLWCFMFDLWDFWLHRKRWWIKSESHNKQRLSTWFEVTQRVSRAQRSPGIIGFNTDVNRNALRRYCGGSRSSLNFCQRHYDQQF